MVMAMVMMVMMRNRVVIFYSWRRNCCNSLVECPSSWLVITMIIGTLILILMLVLVIILTLILRRNKSISQRAAMVRLIIIVGRAYAIQVAYLRQHHRCHGHGHRHHGHGHHYPPHHCHCHPSHHTWENLGAGTCCPKNPEKDSSSFVLMVVTKTTSTPTFYSFKCER